MKILVLGANGMLGHALVNSLTQGDDISVYASTRANAVNPALSKLPALQIISDVDVSHIETLEAAIVNVKPDVVINCIGLVKQYKDSEDLQKAMQLNAVLPHQIAALCALNKARLIHISTDCVFSGLKGDYLESDPADAKDIYGVSKFLGEVDYPHALTLRTSIIGHELPNASGQTHGLVEWFLAQGKECSGYTKAVFSGLPTVVLANLIRDVVLKKPDLRGVYHVSAAPISKYNLLKLVAKAYGKQIELIPDDRLVIDRSLNSSRFTKQTGFIAPSWEEMIHAMQINRELNV
jgi:dTDP-4-dehydrorhamnose reductase